MAKIVEFLHKVKYLSYKTYAPNDVGDIRYKRLIYFSFGKQLLYRSAGRFSVQIAEGQNKTASNKSQWLLQK